MKKTIKLFGLFAVAAMTLIGCEKEIDAPEEITNKLQETVVEPHIVTISAGAPETKTVINEGVKASFKWSADDASRFHVWENEVQGTGITLETNDEYATVKLTATFATVSADSYTYSAFLANNVVDGTNPQIPAAQTCTGTAYDPNADILVAQPVTKEGSVLDKLDMKFGRPCVINKMTLKGLTVGETVSSVEIYADVPLTGYYDIAGTSWTGESRKITLTTSQVVPASGQVTVYFVTMPVADATLTVTAITDAHVYNKTFGSTINFVLDQVTKFGVSSLGMFKYRDVITQGLTGLETSGTSYTYVGWSGKSYSGALHSSAVYAGKTCKSVEYIQVRGSDGSGIITTNSGGSLKRVFVAYTASQNPKNGRIVTVLGKNSAYSATSDLYDDETKGTEAGTFTYLTEGIKVSSLNAAAEYDYVAFLPDGAIYFDEIDVFWDDAKSDPGIKWTADGNTGDAVAAASAALKTGADDMPAAALYNPNSVSVSYSSTDEDVAEINASTGVITLKSAGATTIKATFAGNATYKATVASYTLTVSNNRSTVATPSFSPAGSAVEANSTVRISSDTPNATIYYKVGSAPTTSVYDGYSTLVDGSDKPYVDITIDVAKTVFAIAVKDDWKDSDSNSSVYTITGVASPLDAPTAVTFVPAAIEFTATWTNDSNADGYSWVISTSSTAAGIVTDGGSKNVPDGGFGTFTVGSLAGTGASLTGSKWTLSKSLTLTAGTTYYFYVLADGSGDYADSEYSSANAKALYVTKLTNAQIVANGNPATGYDTYSITGDNSLVYNAYAIKNKHSNATAAYHYLQLKKYSNPTASYIQVPAVGSKIVSLRMTVSSASQPMTGGGNTATLFFSSSNSTSKTGTGVVSGNGDSSITIGTSSLNLNTGYITTSAGIRVWDLIVFYENW